MKTLFFMMVVKSEEIFIKQVNKMADQKNANLFYCQINGDVFRISTAKRVQDFNFKLFQNEEEIIRLIQLAMQILKEKLPHQKLLFDHGYII